VPQAPLLWQAALLELAVGTQMLVAPPLFSGPSYAPLFPYLPLAALVFLLGGTTALLAATGLVPERLRGAAPVIAAVPMVLLAVNFRLTNVITEQIAYVIEAAALLVLALYEQRYAQPRVRIFVHMIAAILALQGASMVLQPGYYENTLVYAELARYLWLFAPLFLLGGIGLIRAERGTNQRVLLSFAALAALDLSVLVGAFTTSHVWTGVMLYGVIAIVLLLSVPRIRISLESPILFASLAAVAAAGDLVNGLIVTLGGTPVVPGWAIMRPPTALALLFVSTAFAVALRSGGTRLRGLTAALGLLALLIGATSLIVLANAAPMPASEVVAGLLGSRIDDDMTSGTFMAPAIVVGASLVLLLFVARPRSRATTHAFIVLGSLTIGVVALNLLAYMLDSEFLIDIFGQFAIRQHATVALGALALGIIAVGITRLVTAPVADRLFGVLTALGILVMIRGFVSDTALWHIYYDVADVGVFAYQQSVEQARNLMLALIAAVSVGAGIVFARTITLPLDEVLRAISRARAGEARAHADVESDDEIGIVARSFNQLTRELADGSDLNAAVKKAQSDLGEAIVILRDGEPEQWNDALPRITGYTDEELRAMPSITMLWPGTERAEIQAVLRSRAAQTYQIETALQKKGDGLVDLEIAVIPLPGSGAGTQLAIMRDITERKTAERGLHRLALHDALTDLPNRALFTDRLDRTIAAAQRASDSFSVLYLDLDRFKEVNDAFGHGAGDALLRELAKRLAAQLGGSDTLARFGGDEFAILLPRARTVADALSVGEILQAVLQRPYDLDRRAVYIEASLGAVVYPADGQTADALLRHADIAMYQAKRTGKGLVPYSVEQDPQSQKRIDLMSDLRHAIERDELFLHFQPQVRPADATSCNQVEALVRWRHPVRGSVAPSDFIPLAEESGFINELTRWVLREALSNVAAFSRAGRDMRVAVNLSARNLQMPGLAELVARDLAEFGVSASSLTLELTETAVMLDAQRGLETLTKLAAVGVRLSIDDFGTGYSSLANLRRLPVNELKIDRSFVADMVTNPSSGAIVRSIVQLGHSMGLTVVAEGIEDAATLAALSADGCDLAQGYHMARPMAFDALVRWTDAMVPVLPASAAAA
jgi:diguanylate cyclase (GGDEF)-like protein/PAS domain S-box-containing protein